MSVYKFTPGQYFKLKPTARIKWLVYSNHSGSGVGAIRVDTEIGQKLSAWILAGSNLDKKPCSHAEVRELERTFWPHDLTTAELA